MRRVAVFALFIFLSVTAFAQDPHDHTLLGDAGKFYSEWKIPNGGQLRWKSCCNQQDCHETQVRMVSGKWQFKSWRYNGAWRDLPEEVIEHNQPDPRISPDGKAHVCEPPVGPICAVIPGGQI